MTSISESQAALMLSAASYSFQHGVIGQLKSVDELWFMSAPCDSCFVAAKYSVFELAVHCIEAH